MLLVIGVNVGLLLVYLAGLEVWAWRKSVARLRRWDSMVESLNERALRETDVT